MGQELKILTTIWPVVCGVVLCIGTSSCDAAATEDPQRTLESIECRVLPSTSETFCYFFNKFTSNGTSSSEWNQYGQACRSTEQYFRRAFNTSQRVTKLSVYNDQELTYIYDSLTERTRFGSFVRRFLFGYGNEWDDRSDKTFIVDVIGNLIDKTGFNTTTFRLKSGYCLFYDISTKTFSVPRCRNTRSFQANSTYLICKAKAPSSVLPQNITFGSMIDPGRTTTPRVPRRSRTARSYVGRGVYFGRPWHLTHVRHFYASSTPPASLTVPILVTVVLGSANLIPSFLNLILSLCQVDWCPTSPRTRSLKFAAFRTAVTNFQ